MKEEGGRDPRNYDGRVNVILITAGIMVVLGSVVALIWWRLADSMFPGASRKTGQQIRLGRAGGNAKGAEGARVIRGFGESGQDEPGAKPDGPRG
jgi:hypothetical protein